MLSEETEKRLRAMVDPTACVGDALYNLQVSMFRQWCTATQMALEDEGVDPAQAQRVINRLIYAHPDGATAYERIDRHARDVETLSNNPHPLRFSAADLKLPPR